MLSETQPPRVLLSYSHDSPEHEARVLALSDRLRDDGIDAILDQYETFPKQGWIQWMNQQLEHAQFVLVVWTETYLRRAKGEEEAGVGLGATHESNLVQQLLYNSGGLNDKFIPVVFTADDRAHIHLTMQRYTFFRLTSDAGYEALYRHLTSQPKVIKKELGKLRALAPRKAKPDFRNSFWNVPPRNHLFTGRETYLNALHQNLAQTNAVALSGIGGIGKTQTAIEYAHRYRAEYQSVLWAGADDNGFATLANVLDLPEKSEKELSAVAAGVTRWLESHSGWLLILDNIDTVEDLNSAYKLVPSGSNGHLFITTRLNSTGSERNAWNSIKWGPRRCSSFSSAAAIQRRR